MCMAAVSEDNNSQLVQYVMNLNIYVTICDYIKNTSDKTCHVYI